MSDSATSPPAPETRETAPWRSALALDRVGLFLGPALLVGWLAFIDRSSLSPEAHRLAGILLLTLVWWVTEPIPIPATSLLAVALCVVLRAVPEGEEVRSVLAPFADPSVFFLMGGLFIGRAMSRHGLDRRLALALLCTRWAGRTPGTVLAALGLATTLLSMWISNTAATAMMCPVAVGIVSVLAAARGSAVSDPRGGFAQSPYASALLLITAFGASVGGVATPVGTATNVVALGFLRQPEVLGRHVDFLAWCAVGVPMMLLIFAGMYAWLRLQAPAHGLDLEALRKHLRAEYSRLGAWKRGEVNTLLIFLTVVALWVTPGVLALIAPEAEAAFRRRFPEEITALLAPVLLFLLPVDRRRRLGTLEAADWGRIDWGTLLLFGSALALGGLMFRTGLAETLGRGAFGAVGTRDVWALTAVAIGAGIILSEFTSNTATVAALLPVVHRLCVEAGADPLPPLLGLTFGASFGSALPVSTPPNAIVYGSGLVPVRRMVRGGVGLDLIAGVVIWVVLRIACGALHWTPLGDL
jgi:solute carrier family 13 (sodium-dependent dicarboxylate transporter), member 2/3/5